MESTHHVSVSPGARGGGQWVGRLARLGGAVAHGGARGGGGDCPACHPLGCRVVRDRGGCGGAGRGVWSSRTHRTPSPADTVRGRTGAPGVPSCRRRVVT